MDWSKLPDLVAVGLLAGAFASVARRSHTPISDHWLFAWLLIVVHFLAFMFVPLPGLGGEIATFAGVLGLVWAGIFFMRACVPYRQERSSLIMLAVVLASSFLYLFALLFNGPAWSLEAAAAFLGLGPLTVALSTVSRFRHLLRVVTVGLQVGLAVFLLAVQHRANGGDLALNAILFTVYLSTSIHFLIMFRRATAGAFITTTGFFLWALVFVVGPLLQAYSPQTVIEGEVWNLPKYIVAVGMILSLLEDQIAHNKHLALHDELTGLPNRRLFQDRLYNALERARRNGTQAALLTLDLDHFKQVNDSLGHHAGDLLLQNVANLLNVRVRRSDTVARTGGDEFAVVLEAPTTPAEAAIVGNSLLELLTVPMSLKDQTVRVGASLGCAIFPDDAEDMEALCIKADLRMYENKRMRNPEEAGGPSEIRTMPRRRPHSATTLL